MMIVMDNIKHMTECLNYQEFNHQIKNYYSSSKKSINKNKYPHLIVVDILNHSNFTIYQKDHPKI